MKRKLHILFIASWYPNKKNPSNGDFVQRHAIAISQFCRVSLLHVTSDDSLAEPLQILKKENEHFIETIVYYKPSFFKLKNYYKAFQAGLEQILKTDRIDLIHLNVISPCGLGAIRLKQMLKVPLVITEHWTAFTDNDPTPIRWIDKFIIKKTLRYCDVLAPVSKDLGNAILKWHPGLPIKIIPNVVDTKHFNYRTKPNTNTFNFIHVSTLDNSQKNISGLLNGFKYAFEKDKQLRLTLIGQNIHKEYLHFVKENDLTGAVIFKPFLPHQKIANELNQSHAFVLFSNFENLPCVIIEALACGLPVISSDVGGIAEMLNDENGLLVEPKNEEQLAGAMLQLKNNYHRYHQEIISEKAKQKYDMLSVGKQYFELYQATLKNE